MAGLRAIKIPVKNTFAKVKSGSLAIRPVYDFYMATISKQVASHLPFSRAFRLFYVEKGIFYALNSFKCWNWQPPFVFGVELYCNRHEEK
jgi:hypothetical protein